MLSLQDLVGGLHVLNASVGAGANHDLVDLDVLTLFGKMRVFGQMRVADRRLERVEVNHDGALILGVGVGLVLGPRALAAAFEVGLGHFIHGEDAVLGTGLDGHVADAESILHRQGLDALADKFQALVQCARDADLTNQVQNDVLAGDGLVQLTLQLDLDGGGDLEPGHAFRHAGGHIGGADAGGERAHRTVGTGVAVRADDAVARSHDALFGQQCVLNAHAAHVEKVEDIVLVGELAALLGLGRALDVLVGDKVIQHDVDAGVIEHRVEPCFFKFVDGHRGGDIIAEHHIELGVDELARRDGCFPAVGR